MSNNKTMNTETRKLIDSDDYYASMQLIAKFYDFTEDEVGMLIGRIDAYLMGNITNENLIPELISELDITEDKAKSIADRVKKEVILPFKEKLAATPSISKAPAPTSPFPTHQTPPQPRVEEPMTKEHTLAQIENPPRTIIKKYVLVHEEHGPVKDTDHLIDDPAHHRAKLEAHYDK